MRHPLSLLALLLVYPAAGRATCDAIPGAQQSFRGATANVDRPFASPGDVLRLSHDPTCHGSVSGFAQTPAGNIVTVVFKPPTGPSHAVVLATDCAVLEGARQACESRADIATASCLTVNQPGGTSDITVVDARQLHVRFPDTDALLRVCTGGGNAGRACTTDVECPSGSCSGGLSDDLTFTGPAAIGVTAAGQPLPCALASAPCTNQTGLVACIDALYADLGDVCASVPSHVFSHFTALPPPNDYAALCESPSPPCAGTVDDLRFTVDGAGNVLLPMDMRGVLVRRNEVPVARLLRGATTVEAFEDTGQALHVEDQRFLASYSPRGAKLPPLFDPQLDPEAADALTLFGTADAPASVVRIARRSPGRLACAGGPNADAPCSVDADCPSSTCGARICVGGPTPAAPCVSAADCAGGDCRSGLFDFDSRLVGGVGPVVLRLGACLGGTTPLDQCTVDAECPQGQCTDFTMLALSPVPLDGLVQTDTVNAFVMAEPIENVDLNGDGDTFDDVVRIGSRSTGALHAIGNGGAAGRAVVRIRKPPFSFPALAAEGDVVAFLESEPGQAALDLNGDGDVFDALVRAFRLTSDGAVAPSLTGDVVADGAPVINQRPIAISNGRIFVRHAEDAAAHRSTTRYSGGPANTFSPALSRDGRYVAYEYRSFAGRSDILATDRESGATEVATVSTGGALANDSSQYPVISQDGRFIAFVSTADNLVPDDTNGPGLEGTDVFVRDRLLGVTERISVASDGAQGDGPSGIASLSISGDGRFVAFVSAATNLVGGDTNGATDVFLRDRSSGLTERISVNSAGIQGNGASEAPSLSGDGRFVSFVSWARNLDAGDSTYPDAFIRDRIVGTTRLVSRGLRGEPANERTFATALSSDGRVVAIASQASNLVAGDTNGATDVFVYDRVADLLERVSVDSNGQQGNSVSSGAYPFNPFGISEDGRLVVFSSAATNLVPDDTNAWVDVFLRDRTTGLTARVNIGEGRTQSNNSSRNSALSADGKVVAFSSHANNLTPGTVDVSAEDVFTRASDPADTASDRTGNGRARDVVLQVIDGATGDLLEPACPATQVAVASGRAVFLRPEAAGPAMGCPNAAPSLNGDADHDDEVVHLWMNEEVSNLHVAATAVGLSESTVAALVSEAGQATTPLNGDGDAADDVLHVRSLAGAAWTNTGQAAVALSVEGTLVAILTDEGSQGVTSLNADGDVSDRVLQVYDASTGTWLLGAATTPRSQAATDLVLGGSPGAEIVAFRTPENAEGRGSLNGDGDVADDVLQIFDVATGNLINTGAAVTPCRLEACDPRTPYRVQRDTVTFLTLEADQSADLNGDGDQLDLVLQVFNVRQLVAGGPRVRSGRGSVANPLRVIAAVSAGVCTHTGAACGTDAECPSGTCFVPPGGCTRTLGTICDPSSSGACGSGNFCEPLAGTPGQGTCKRVESDCAATADCTSPAVCVVGSQGFQRFLSPLTTPLGGGLVLSSTGRCIEGLPTSCTSDADCPGDWTCRMGSCRRDQGTCRTDADCPAPSVCTADVLTGTSGDEDGDEVLDSFDNCPTVPNVDQADADGDSLGDACELAPTPTITAGGLTPTPVRTPTPTRTRTPTPTPTVTPGVCGDGTPGPGEDCDDGDILPGDGCDAACQLESAPACPPEPESTCRKPLSVGASTLQLRRDASTPRRDALRWTWGRGAETAVGDFGTPSQATGAGYALCLYDAGSLALRVAIAPGGTCDGRPCWKARSTGFGYKSKSFADGRLQLNLKAGAARTAKIVLKASGSALGMPPLNSVTGPIVTQIFAKDHACWDASFGAPFGKHDARLLNDRSD